MSLLVGVGAVPSSATSGSAEAELGKPNGVDLGISRNYKVMMLIIVSG